MAVGRGMLDAACPGDVFAAPPSDYVYETTKIMNSPKGVLHIINNYTGDKNGLRHGLASSPRPRTSRSAPSSSTTTSP